ncbi:MAG: hypothetical protein WCJ58_00945 [bacterium]
MQNEFEIADFQSLEEIEQQIIILFKAKRLILERELNKIDNFLKIET